jgi:hypothetical protein
MQRMHTEFGLCLQSKQFGNCTCLAAAAYLVDCLLLKYYRCAGQPVSLTVLLAAPALLLCLRQAKDTMVGTAQSAKESAQSEADRVSMGKRWKEEMLEGDLSA